MGLSAENSRGGSDPELDISIQDPLCDRWVNTEGHYDKEINFWQMPTEDPGDQLCEKVWGSEDKSSDSSLP